MSSEWYPDWLATGRASSHQKLAPVTPLLKYACHLRGQNLANTVSELLHPEHGTLYRYISVRQPSADNSSSLGSKLISSNVPTYDFYLRELLRSELTYLVTYFLRGHRLIQVNLERGRKTVCVCVKQCGIGIVCLLLCHTRVLSKWLNLLPKITSLPGCLSL